ncbi:OsmC family peroxiredoxin [Anaerocolumna sedimenticola]|uniref:OsmC family peroxiredoxin n=1 Tax=Anaerocolumna sedimenticola TaxID=2696063 RepID=A0A6P1TED9_9FIRM|nr:OsmC family protein [Anaerocolumna sedimenticola]QHQ59600.1 OsmC family peroxiredoxin [Anaerocolumna sedimenticola]
MSNDFLEINLKSIDNKVKFSATSRSNPEVVIDYFPPFGTGEGYTSLELLLFSFSSCVCSTMAIILRNQMQRNISSLHAKAKGYVKEEHPKALSKIELELFIESSDTQETDVEKTLVALENKLCPVWAMIKGNVLVETKFSIIG